MHFWQCKAKNAEILTFSIFLDRSTTQEVTVVMGALYASSIFLGVNNASSVQPVVSIERTVFYREKAAGMYSPIPYAIAQVCTMSDYKIYFNFLSCIKRDIT